MDDDDEFGAWIIGNALLWFGLIPIWGLFLVILSPFILLGFFTIKGWIQYSSWKNNKIFSFKYEEHQYSDILGKKYVVYLFRMSIWSVIGLAISLLIFLLIYPIFQILDLIDGFFDIQQFWILFIIFWVLISIFPLVIGYYRERRKRLYKEKIREIREIYKKKIREIMEIFDKFGPVIPLTDFSRVMIDYQISVQEIESRGFLFPFFNLKNGYIVHKHYIDKFIEKYEIRAIHPLLRILTERLGSILTKKQWLTLAQEPVQIEKAIKNLLAFFQRNNRLPDREELLLIEIPQKLIDTVIHLINLEIEGEKHWYKDLDKKDVVKLEDYTLLAVKKLPVSKWTFENLALTVNIPFLYAKIIPDYNNWVVSSDLLEIEDLYNNSLGTSYQRNSELLKKWDKDAVLLMRIQQKKLKASTFFQIGEELGKTPLETRLLMNYVQNVLQDPPTIKGQFEFRLPQIEKTAKKIASARKKGEIQDGGNLLENILKLNWRNLTEAILVTQFYSKNVINQKFRLETTLKLDEEIIPIKHHKTPDFLSLKTIMIDDLTRGNAVLLTKVQRVLECRNIQVPQKVKSIIHSYRSTKDISLVIRSDLMLVVEDLTKGKTCQLCSDQVKGNHYFQCQECSRFLCLPHFTDLLEVQLPSCPSCEGKLGLFPFTCNGCSLDFTEYIDMKNNFAFCHLCGFKLPTQTSLIKEKIPNYSLPVHRSERIYDDSK